MHIEEHRWHSPHLGREMALKVYGHWGAPYIVFPCSRGRYFDYEGMGMIAALAGFIDAGRVKLFAVDSVDAESWYDFGAPPAARNARHEAYDRYITAEVVPFVRQHCASPEARVMANGCSMGAYHAVNFFLRHPDLFAGTIALSGLYRLDRPEFGLGPADLPQVYFNSPLSYLPGLQDPWYLERYRASRIVVCVGQGAWEHEALEDTRELDRLLHAHGTGAWVDYWGPDVNHDWPWWYRQMTYFLGHLHP
jgi:esterase/lipase superfamily enzyme